MKDRFFAWWVDVRNGDLNPVMVRELRQYVRSRFANWVVLLMLAAMLLITIGFFTEAKGRVTVTGLEMTGGSGTTMFGALVAVLSVVSMMLALYTAQRMGSERLKTNLDMMFITGLRPGQVMRGKLFAGLAMFWLFFSLAMPFMTMTYLLRGIDIRVILQGLLGLGVGSLLMLNAALLVGCLPLGPLFQRGGLALVAMGVFMIGPAISQMVVFGVRYGGMGSGGWDWRESLAMTFMMVASFWVPYALAVLILSPPRSNRFLPFRLTLTVLWLVGLATAGIEHYVMGGSSQNFLGLWVISGTPVLLFFLQVSEGMSDSLSPRVRQRVPRSFPGRLLAFPFFTGGINGTVWALLLLAGYALFLVFGIADVWTDDEFHQVVATVLYALCYILTAGWISRRLPEQWRKGAATPWLLTFYFVAAAAFIPAAYDVLRENYELAFKPKIEFGNLFFAFRGQAEYAMLHASIAGCWFVLLGVPTLLRTMTAFERFQRSSEEAARPQP